MVIRSRIRTITRRQYEHSAKRYRDYLLLDCTPLSRQQGLARDLSPSFIGPIATADGSLARSFRNFIEWSRVTESEFDPDSDVVLPHFFANRDRGFALDSCKKKRGPSFGKPLFSYFYLDGEWKRYGHLAARKLIHIPTYAKAVVGTKSFAYLKGLALRGKKILLLDEDGRDFYYDKKITTIKDVVNESGAIGPTLVLKMLLQGDIEVVGDEVKDHAGILEVGTDLSF